MRRLHLLVGLLGVVLFLASGLYMHFGHDHLRGLADGPRLLFRSGHIYLFFSAILNAVLGLYLRPAAGGWRRLLQTVASALFLASTVLCSVGFLVEPGLSDLDRPYSRLAIYGTGVGLLLFLASAWPRRGGRLPVLPASAEV